MTDGELRVGWYGRRLIVRSVRRACLLFGCVVAMAAHLGCSAQKDAGRFPVVATTTLVGDAVRTVGGDQVSLTVLLPIGADPHSFEPSPRDVSALSHARLVFANGLGLEGFLEPLLENTVDPERIVVVSEGIVPQPGPTDDETHSHDVNPHVWFVPQNVASWAARIAEVLAEADPAHAALYAARADSYAAVLDSLDGWIRDQVDAIPPERRVLLTDHATLGYFARHYGFQEAGTILPGVTTVAEPSARDLADRARFIRAEGVPAVFVGMASNAELTDRIASDAGIAMVRLYTESLSSPRGPAPDYVAFMRYNVLAIVAGLTGSVDRGDG